MHGVEELVYELLDSSVKNDDGGRLLSENSVSV